MYAVNVGSGFFASVICYHDEFTLQQCFLSAVNMGSILAVAMASVVIRIFTITVLTRKLGKCFISRHFYPEGTGDRIYTYMQ